MFYSCSNDVKIKDEQTNHSPVERKLEPNEPCEDVSWASRPVITQGYHDSIFDIVIVETYKKNARFDSLIKRYEIKNDGQINDSIRMSKSFNLPDEIHSNVDLKIIFNKKEEFKITHVNTGWTPRMGNDEFLGYECEIQHFEVNGEKMGGNIRIKHPDFKYQW